jgi:di/tricarboxylate transporter
LLSRGFFCWSHKRQLVYGSGGYRFSDFLRIGLPVKAAFLAVSILFVIIVYPLTPLNS